MKKILFILIVNFTFLSAFSQHNPYIEQFQAKSRQAYQKYANPVKHQQIKSQKTTMSYNVGDTTYFWRWDLSVMPPTWIYEKAVCKAVGNQSYVFVSDAQWDVNINQADVDEIMSFLEDSTLNTTSYGIVSMDTMLFGNIPDELDNDPKVIFYFTNLGSYHGTVFDGYFSEYNQMTEAEAQADDAHSNECEMLYMSCSPVNPTAISTFSVLSHELQHLIHWGYDTDEETWFNEGCSELAMVKFGAPDPIVDFNGNPNDNLIDWGQHFSDYIQVQLFFTYLYEQFGEEFTKNLVQDTLNGIDAINKGLVDEGYTINFDTVFDTWTLANFIHDKQVDTGQYGYSLLNMPNFSYTEKSTYPIDISSSLNNCASRYYKIPPDNGQTFSFNFQNPDNWDVNLIFYDENDSLVDISNLDLSQNYIVPQYTESIGRLYFSLSNHYKGYSTDAYSTTITSNSATVDELRDCAMSMRQKSSQITLIIPSNDSENSVVNIYDIAGKLIYSKENNLTKGLNFIEIPTNNFNFGVYLVQFTIKNQKFNAKFVKK